jgi:hypothetical protein
MLLLALLRRHASHFWGRGNCVTGTCTGAIGLGGTCPLTPLFTPLSETDIADRPVQIDASDAVDLFKIWYS